MNRVSTKKGDETRKIILKYIVEYIDKHCYPPTHREICEMTGIKSTSTINHHIAKMIECGMLETDCEAGTSRALRVPGYSFIKVEISFKMAISALSEIQQYQAIGTVEECREARERQMAKKPQSINRVDEETIYMSCANCGLSTVLYRGMEPDYCPKCGQAIDWSGTD